MATIQLPTRVSLNSTGQQRTVPSQGRLFPPHLSGASNQQQFVALRTGPNGSLTLAAEDTTDSGAETLILAPIQGFSNATEQQYAIALPTTPAGSSGFVPNLFASPAVQQKSQVPPGFAPVNSAGDSQPLAYRLVPVPGAESPARGLAGAAGQVTLVPVSGGGMVALPESSGQEVVTRSLIETGSRTEKILQKQHPESVQFVQVGNQNSSVIAAARNEVNRERREAANEQGGGGAKEGRPIGELLLAGSCGQELQIQTLDTTKGQCYFLMPSEAQQQAASVSQPQNAANFGVTSATTSLTSGRNVISVGLGSSSGLPGKQLPQATFIPLSRLESTLVGGSRTGEGSSANESAGNVGSARSAESPDIFKEKRRSSHNEVEKRRRDKINHWITKLARLLPDSYEDNSRQLHTSMNSKGGILAKTVEFIQNLRATNSHLAETLDSLGQEQLDAISLQQQLIQVMDENKMLKQKLKEAGISSLPEPSTQQKLTFTVNMPSKEQRLAGQPSVSSKITQGGPSGRKRPAASGLEDEADEPKDQSGMACSNSDGWVHDDGSGESGIF